jgi:hypothetical protein
MPGILGLVDAFTNTGNKREIAKQKALNKDEYELQNWLRGQNQSRDQTQKLWDINQLRNAIDNKDKAGMSIFNARPEDLVGFDTMDSKRGSVDNSNRATGEIAKTAGDMEVLTRPDALATASDQAAAARAEAELEKRKSQGFINDRLSTYKNQVKDNWNNSFLRKVLSGAEVFGANEQAPNLRKAASDRFATGATQAATGLSTARTGNTLQGVQERTMGAMIPELTDAAQSKVLADRAASQGAFHEANLGATTAALSDTPENAALRSSLGQKGSAANLAQLQTAETREGFIQQGLGLLKKLKDGTATPEDIAMMEALFTNVQGGTPAQLAASTAAGPYSGSPERPSTIAAKALPVGVNTPNVSPEDARKRAIQNFNAVLGKSK